MSFSNQGSTATPHISRIERQWITTPRVTPILTVKPLQLKSKRGTCSYVVILYNPKNIEQSFVLGSKTPHDMFKKINTTLEAVRAEKGFTDKLAYDLRIPNLPYLSLSLCKFLASVQYRTLKAIVVARYNAQMNRGVRPMLNQRLKAFTVKMEDEQFANAVNLAAITTV